MDYLTNYDLRAYLANAVLPAVNTVPEPPATDEQELLRHPARLAIPNAGPDRSLYKVHRIATFHKVVQKYMNVVPQRISKPTLNNITGDRFTIPAEDSNIGPTRPHRPSTCRMAVEELPLQTAARAFQTIFPQYADWCFMQLWDNEPGPSFLHSLHFTQSLELPDVGNSTSTRKVHGEMTKSTSFRVHVIPPHILTRRVFDEVVKGRDVSPMYPAPIVAGVPEEKKYNQEEELAIYIWHKLAALTEGAGYFVLTNYDQWMFGCFCRTWKRAFISKIIDHDSMSPTVVQCLVLWMGSSLGKGGWRRPHAPDSIHDTRRQYDSYIPQKYTAVRTLDPHPTESDAGTEIVDLSRDEAVEQKLADSIDIRAEFRPYNTPREREARAARIVNWTSRPADNTGVAQKYLEPGDYTDVPDSDALSYIGEEEDGMPDVSTYEQNFHLKEANFDASMPPPDSVFALTAENLAMLKKKKTKTRVAVDPNSLNETCSVSEWSAADSGTIRPFGSVVGAVMGAYTTGMVWLLQDR